MSKIRSAIFDVLFYILTSLYLLIFFVPMLLLPRDFVVKLYQYWAKGVMWLLKNIVGLDYQIENADILNEMLAKGPCIIACKHQSAWETIIFATIVPNFVVVLKKQLLWIPVFGLYLKKLNSIAIDRKQGIKSIKQIISSSKDAVKNGLSILIFPEGTRQSVGSSTTYQVGIASIYNNLNVPVLPVALNSGLYWGRKSTHKLSGTIILKFLPPILPGLPKKEFMSLLHNNIESACTSISFA